MNYPSLTFIAYSLLVLISSCNPTKETSATPSMAQEIDSLITTFHAYGGFKGSVLVAHEGNVVFQKGYGPAHREWDTANAPDTKFRIASLTKPFTAMLTLQLVAEGTLDLHACPYFKIPSGISPTTGRSNNLAPLTLAYLGLGAGYPTTGFPSEIPRSAALTGSGGPVFPATATISSRGTFCL